MLHALRRGRLPVLVLAAALCAVVCPAADAKESAASVRDAEQYIAAGDLKAAAIELKNAVRGSPQDPAIRVRLAQVYLRLEDFGSAEREARAAREFNSNEADYLPILADALLRQKKFKDTLDLIEPGDREPVLESKVRTALGIAATGMGYGERAEEMLRDAIRLDPSAVKPRIQLARFLNATNPRAADQVIDDAIVANPQSAEPLQVKGELLWSRGDADGAVHLFDEVLKIDPKNLRARLSRADVNVALNQFTAADEDLDPILQAAPDNFMANYLRGSEQVRQEQYAAADRTFDRISPAFPLFPAGYYLQGAVKLGLGQYESAENILARYLRNVPGDPKARRLIASAALAQHGAPRAIDYLTPIVERLPPDPDTLTLLGNAYMADGKPELALQQFEKAAALDPQNPNMKTRVAVAEIDAGSGRRGLERLEQLFASEVGAAFAGPSLVLSELQAGRLDKAAEVVTSLIKRDPDNPLYQTLLGEVRVAQRDYSGAEAAFRGALARSPEFSAATRDLGQLYVATGRIADAKRIYNERLLKKADDLTALLGLADIAIVEEKWSEATDLLNRARGAAKFDPTPGLKLEGLYEARRDWKSAKAVAAELSAQFPRDVNVIVARGRSQTESGDIEGAISSYKLAYQLAPNSTPILSRYVSLLKQAKYFREAWDVLQQAIARGPQNTSLKADLVRVDSEVDGIDQAVAMAQEFVRSDPDNNLYPIVSAELYEGAGRAAEAAALLEKAVAARPSDDVLAVALSQLYTRTGNFLKAEALLTGRLKTDPKNLVVNLALAPIYMITGRPEDARKIYIASLSQKSTDLVALIGLADIAIGEMKWEDATGYLSRAHAAAPDDPAPQLRLVKLAALRQDSKGALAAAADLAAKYPTNLDVLDAKGQAQIADGEKDGAVATYKRLYELAPKSRLAMSRYLAVLDLVKKFPEAQTVLRSALDRDPQNTSLKSDLIRVEAEIGGLDAGLAVARDFAKTDPDTSLYDVVSADLYEKSRRVGDAIGLLEKSFAARPSDSRLTIALSGLYARTGVPSKAEALLEARLKADPKDIDARSVLASLYLDQKRYPAAVAEFSRVIHDRPADPSALNNLAWLYQQQGDLGQARELAERAFAITPRSAQIDDTLGWIVLGQGEAAKSLTYLGTAYSQSPGDPGIQYHLAVALHRVGRSADARAMLESLLSSGVSFADKTEAEEMLLDLKRG